MLLVPSSSLSSLNSLKRPFGFIKRSPKTVRVSKKFKSRTCIIRIKVCKLQGTVFPKLSTIRRATLSHKYYDTFKESELIAVPKHSHALSHCKALHPASRLRLSRAETSR